MGIVFWMSFMTCIIHVKIVALFTETSCSEKSSIWWPINWQNLSEKWLLLVFYKKKSEVMACVLWRSRLELLYQDTFEGWRWFEGEARWLGGSLCKWFFWIGHTSWGLFYCYQIYVQNSVIKYIVIKYSKHNFTNFIPFILYGILRSNRFIHSIPGKFLELNILPKLQTDENLLSSNRGSITRYNI